MTFQLPEDSANLVDDLRAAEPQAPKQVKALLLQAANELHAWHRLAEAAILELKEADALRVGQMDSQSRADEVVRQVRATLQGVAARLQIQLGTNNGRSS